MSWWNVVPSDGVPKKLHADVMYHWKSINTAPKDGTAILLYVPEVPDVNGRPEGMDSKVIVGMFRGQPDRGWWISDIAEYDHGYYAGEFDWEAIEIKPTHWMSLPDPPDDNEDM